MYDYFINVIASNQMIIMAIFFLIILLFGKVEYKLHSLVIFTSSILAYFSSYDTSLILTDEQYIKDLTTSIEWDGATALIMTMFLSFDKKASKQAVLLAFAVSVHTVVLYEQNIYSLPINAFIYNWYDELIITIGLLQMMVSYNGFINAFSNLQSLLYRVVFCGHRLSKGFITRKEEVKRF